MCVPGAQSGAFASFINEGYTAFRQENYFDLSCGLNLYTCRERISLGEEYGRARAWVHVGQSSIAAGQQVQAYQRRLALVEETCRQGRRLTAENIAFLQENYRGGADADAAAKAAGLQLQREQYRQHLCGSGMFLMLSNCVEDKAQACHIYKTRARAAELLAAFRARLAGSALPDTAPGEDSGRSFIAFLALSLYLQLEQALHQGSRRPCPCSTAAEMLQELKAIREIHLQPWDQGQITALSARQRKILAFLRLKTPLQPADLRQNLF